MTTSASYNFIVTRDEIIDLAHQHVGLVGEGETSSTSQITEGAKLLNMIVKLRASDGMPLWSLKRGYVLPFTGASSIATDSHVVTTYVATDTTASKAASATTVTVTSTTGMTAADQVGIELDSGDVYWTTISVVSSSTAFTIPANSQTIAAIGSRVYSYTASTGRVQKPLRILQANIKDESSGNSYIIDVEDRDDYFALSNRTVEGTPVLIYYDQSSTVTTNLDNGSIFVYPRFADGNSVIEFSYHRPFQDFDATGDNPDFPQAFYLPLMLELAALLGPKAGVSATERQALFAEAKMYREEALETVAPEGSLSIQPDVRE